MTDKYEIILKKEYAAHTPTQYVCVEQFTLIKRGEDRAVIIRFSNNLGVRVDRIFFTLEQIDKNGNVIILPENEFAVNVCLDADISFEKEILVDRNCVSIRVLVNKVRSGRDEYALVNGEVAVTRNVDSMKNLNISPDLLIPKKAKKGSSGLIVIALAAVALILALNVLVAFLHTT